MKANSFKEIPGNFIAKWQEIADLIATIMNVPSALIMKTEDEYMEVFIASKTEKNPYNPGDKEHWHGLYCETVIKTQSILHIPNALKDKAWDTNPDIKLGMIAYLGIPINFPNQQPFGTLCVLDRKENAFTKENERLLYQFKKVIELDLALIQSLYLTDKNEDFDIVRKLAEQNEEYLTLNEELKQTNHQLCDEKEKVAESEQHFRLLVENAPIAIFIQNDGLFSYVNRETLKLYGSDNEESLLGTPVLERIHPDYRDIVKERISLLNCNKVPAQNIEYKHLKISGEEIIVNVSAVPIFYKGKNGAVVFVTDVTEKVKLENKIHESYELLNHLAAQVPGVIYQYRLYPDGTSAFPYSSPGMYEIYEVTPEEVKADASVVFTRLHPDDIDYIVDSINESAKNQTVYRSEFRVILPKQGLRWRLCQAQPQLMADGSTLWHGIISDITEQKKIQQALMQKNMEYAAAEEELRAANEELQATYDSLKESQLALQHSYDLMQYVIEHNSSAIALHDKDLRYLYVSKKYQKDYNIEGLDVIGKHHYDVFPDLPKKWRDVHTRALAGEVLSADDDLYIKDDGTALYTRWECRPWFDANGAIGGIIVYTEVINDRKQAELQLKEAKEKAEESNRLKTTFLHNMSHEVRTPLNGIVGFSQLIVREGLQPEKLKLYQSQIQKNSRKLIGIITDIIDISQMHSNQIGANMGHFNVSSLTAQVVTEFTCFAEEKKLRLQVELCPDSKIRTIYTDEEKLRKILFHLVDNAIKFTAKGFVRVSARIESDNIHIVVTDTGIGISPTMHQIICEPFRQVEIGTTRSFGGNGIGLALVKAYVKLLEGSFLIESALGQGTSVHISIPITNKKSEPFEMATISRAIKTILVAEDEYSNYQYLKEALTDFNFSLVHASNGEEAVNLCKSRNDIDLVLMDIKMPILDGHSATKIIKDFRPNLPVIAQTAYATEIERAAFIQDFDGYLVKPIEVETLFGLIDTFQKKYSID